MAIHFLLSTESFEVFWSDLISQDNVPGSASVSLWANDIGYQNSFVQQQQQKNN